MSENRRVVDTLRQIDNHDIPYCTLRNFEFVEDGPIHGDIDILVPEEKQEELNSVLQNEGYYRYLGDTTCQTRYLTYLPEERTLIVIDIYWDNPTYNGLPFLDGNRVLANRKRHEEIWIPSDEDLFIELVFHSVLNKNQYRERYRHMLSQLRGSVVEPTVVDHARSVFGSKGAEAAELALDGQLDKILSMKWSLVLAKLRQTPRMTISLFRNLVLLREIERPVNSLLNRLRPSSTPIVAILGPDGVGKSTAVAKVASTLEDNGFDVQTSRMGVHSGATRSLDTVRSLYNYVQGLNKDRPEIGENKQQLGSRGSFLKAAVLTLDWLARFIIAKTSRADVIVADRYLHELPVYTNPILLNQLTQLAEIGPFYGVVLTGSSNTIAERSEFDAESVAKFQDRLKGSELHFVDTSAGPEMVADIILADAMEVILNHLSDE